MILLLDHYDSFTQNLARYLTILGQPPRIVVHDRIDPDTLDRRDYSALILSPGPGRPQKALTAKTLVRRWAGQIPIFGICLGHQVIAQTFGATIEQASRPMHGYLSAVHHDHQGVFNGLPDPLTVTRYHSLIVRRENLPAELVVSAETVEDQLIMGLRHKTLPIESVQFHPEALLTESGLQLMQNFIEGFHL